MDSDLATDQTHDQNVQVIHNALINFVDVFSATKRKAIKQSLWTGLGYLLGVTVAGPVGALVRGIGGSLLGKKLTPDYDGIVEKLHTLDRNEQERLLGEVLQFLIFELPRLNLVPPWVVEFCNGAKADAGAQGVNAQRVLLYAFNADAIPTSVKNQILEKIMEIL